MVKAVYISKDKVGESLAVTPTKGKHNIEPFKTFAKEHGLPFSLLEDVEVNDNEAEVHMHEGDLWLSLQGECTFVCDGELVEKHVKVNKDGSENSNEWRGSAIAGGATYTLRPGDWLWIPAGVPHQHSAVGTARLAVIKIPAKS